MALKKINESPRVTDTILFELTTPDAAGCFTANPYKVDKVTIYYVERDFLGQNHGEYEASSVNAELLIKLKAAEKTLCDDPTVHNAYVVQKLQDEIESSSFKSTFYYKDRVAVKVIGSEGFPAWLSTDVANAELTLVEEDDDGNAVYGEYTYEWTPDGTVREGDYFICWTWTPNSSGDSLSAHLPFTLEGDPRAVVTIPTHMTPTDKYETLLERYLPDMYKNTVSDRDVTPETTDNLNQAIAKGFTFVEDMANQIIDLFDANVLHESLLVYQSNLFNLKLKSDDPTLWRRQIKEAVPLFKKKGTLSGLTDAFAQAGMSLDGYTQFWQIVSPSTSEESFKVGDSLSFTLAKNSVVEATDADNFGLWVRKADDDEYVDVGSDHVEFESQPDGSMKMTWIGDDLSASSVELETGDFIRVLYQYDDVPSQSVEDYIRALPLADTRDETDQDYPPKNWNVRLIAETDPMFSVLVPVRHPFHDPLVFGHVRTEFAYSENIYNMEEYNGSTRPSFDACKIDKEFVDPCGACISSMYSVDIGVQELSSGRMTEALEILRENAPFHAVPYSLNFSGEINEFVQSPVEQIDTLVTFDWVQHVISGNTNPFFHRSMDGTHGDWEIFKDELAEKNTVVSGKIGTAYNAGISLVAPQVSFKSIGVVEHSHIMEVLSPSGNAGTYEIADWDGSLAHVISTVTQPLDEAAFTFNLSNILYSNNTTTITQDDFYEFSDVNFDFTEVGVKTLWDAEHTDDYSGTEWSITLPDYSTTYQIRDIRNGKLILVGDSSLPTSDVSGLDYILLDDDANEIHEGTTGRLEVTRRGKVELHDSSIVEITDFVRAGYYLVYNGDEYPVVEFDGDDFWIGDYEEGNSGGVSVEIRKRLCSAETGYFGYRGLRLIAFSDHETEFEIVNGENPPAEDSITDDSKFKENFLFRINSELFKIASIDGRNVVLAGREQSWKTIDTGGTAVAYSIIHFPKSTVNFGFNVFDHVDKSGADPVIRELEDAVEETVSIVALATSNGGGVDENVTQQESISFTVVRRDGSVQEGEL